MDIKAVKKICLAVLGLLVCLLALAGCGEEKVDVSVERELTADDYSYIIPAGWVKSEKYSSDDKVFYVLDGHEDDETPDNISVEVRSNRYAADEHTQFRDAIVRQLAMQIQGAPRLLTGDGTFTDNEDVLYIFTITEGDEADEADGEAAKDAEAAGVTTRQYYVVGEKKYALIHLTSFSGAEETQAAADRMAKSFCWAGDEKAE